MDLGISREGDCIIKIVAVPALIRENALSCDMKTGAVRLPRHQKEHFSKDCGIL